MVDRQRGRGFGGDNSGGVPHGMRADTRFGWLGGRDSGGNDAPTPWTASPSTSPPGTPEGGIGSTAGPLAHPEGNDCGDVSPDADPFRQKNLRRLRRVYEYLRRNRQPHRPSVEDYLIAHLALYQLDLIRDPSGTEKSGQYLGTVADRNLTAEEIARINSVLCVGTNDTGVARILESTVRTQRTSQERGGTKRD